MDRTEQYSRIEYLVCNIVKQSGRIQDNLYVLRNLPFTTQCECPSHIERDLQKIFSLLKDINSTIDVLHAQLLFK